MGYSCMSAAARGRCSITPNANRAHGHLNGYGIDDTGSLHIDLEESPPDEDEDDEGQTTNGTVLRVVSNLKC